MREPRVTVIIPMFNEELIIRGVCNALLDQTYPEFSVVFVDNNSSDGTVPLVEEYIAAHELSSWKIVTELQKGTGAAADTGVRQAMKDGANIIARTDADCLPSEDWLSIAVQAIQDGAELIAGRVLTRTDDVPVSRFEELVLNFLPTVARVFGRFRPSNRGEFYLGPYMMVAGCNVIFTSDVYFRSGGFPRTKIEEAHEDRGLINNVRKVTTRYQYRKDVTIAMSARRVKAWGILNTLKWYKNHGYRPEKVDIR